ncbi:MAG TPA: hypothetical protein VGG45_03815 [Terracidiphilus sp.]
MSGTRIDVPNPQGGPYLHPCDEDLSPGTPERKSHGEDVLLGTAVLVPLYRIVATIVMLARLTGMGRL